MKRGLVGVGGALVVGAAAGAVGLLLLVLLNGFGERAATGALLVYGGSALVAKTAAAASPWLPIKSLLARAALGMAVGGVMLGTGFFGALSTASAKRPQPRAKTSRTAAPD